MSAAPRPVALVGLPGSGKTTVAALLAERLGWACVDTDREVEAQSGRSPAAIIENDGEAPLREAELRALRRALEGPAQVVVACGGGLLTNAESRALLAGGTTTVWLDAPDNLLLDRLGDAGDRPLLAGDPAGRLAELRRARSHAYGDASLRVCTDSPPAQVADRIARVLNHSLRLQAASRESLVVVQQQALDDISLHLPAAANRVAIVCDLAVRRIARRAATQLKSSGRSVTVLGLRGGERIKTWSQAGRLLARLGAAGLRRGDCVVALGGGSVGDLTGFAAATHLRGVAWLNVPTTLLAMVDSAVGGKTGVNLPRGKNLAGAIWQPRAVLCDPTLLEGLPERQYRSALAEVIKYAMVSEDGLASVLDRDLDGLLRRDPELLLEVVRRCCEAKAAAVAEDERETGRRALLNYGHTVGHALEAATSYSSELNHGEAIAVGMRVAGALSVLQLGCPQADIEWQNAMLQRCRLGEAPQVTLRRVVAALAADKKHSGVSLEWVLLESRGRARYGQVVPEDVVEAEIRRVLPA